MKKNKLKSDQALIVGQYIKAFRMKRKLTQYELASRAGVSQASLSKMERGKTIPNVLDWMNFCDSLKAPYDFKRHTREPR